MQKITITLISLALLSASVLAGEPVKPTAVFKPAPAYPEAARAAGVHGDVKLAMVVDERGFVTDVEVLGDSPVELAEAARQAVIGWRFEPARVDSEPVAVRYEIVVSFKLDDGDKIPSADEDGIVPPLKISGGQPAYPEAARKAGLQGTVVLSTVIGKDGGVHEIRVLEGQSGGLTEAAVRAIETWRFQPATRNGEAVDVRYALTTSFRLE